MSDVRSINEPAAVRTTMLTPMSINEPRALPGFDAPAPVITSLTPAEATIGAPSFTLYVTGENFYPGSVIMFATQLEPTTLEADGRLSTGVNMAVWHGPDQIPVLVLNGEKVSNAATFVFLPAEAGGLEAADPDELEEEIEEAEEDGDFKSMHRSRTKKK